jgi:hypothetical protein
MRLCSGKCTGNDVIARAAQQSSSSKSRPSYRCPPSHLRDVPSVKVKEASMCTYCTYVFRKILCPLSPVFPTIISSPSWQHSYIYSHTPFCIYFLSLLNILYPVNFNFHFIFPLSFFFLHTFLFFLSPFYIYSPKLHHLIFSRLIYIKLLKSCARAGFMLLFMIRYALTTPIRGYLVKASGSKDYLLIVNSYSSK